MLTLDSNVLVYAIDHLTPIRQRRAIGLITATSAVPAFITQQVIGEFCNVARRKRRMPAADIRQQVDAWQMLFSIEPTSVPQLLAAADLAERCQKQFWDMVLVRVAADAGATTLLTEDIGDSETISGVRIINPFNPANDAIVATLLTPPP